MDTKKTGKELRLNGGVTAAIVDGHKIAVNNDNGMANIAFFQVDPFSMTNDAIYGSVVANVRMSINDLENFGRNIEESVREYRSKTKK